MRAALRTARYWVPLVAGFLFLVVSQFTGPIVALVLFFVAFALILDGMTAMWARAARAGGLTSYRQ